MACVAGMVRRRSGLRSGGGDGEGATAATAASKRAKRGGFAAVPVPKTTTGAKLILETALAPPVPEAKVTAKVTAPAPAAPIPETMVDRVSALADVVLALLTTGAASDAVESALGSATHHMSEYTGLRMFAVLEAFCRGVCPVVCRAVRVCAADAVCVVGAGRGACERVGYARVACRGGW